MEIIPHKLIGIHGHAHVGKDTAALFIHENYQDCWSQSFAGPLKTGCAELFGLSESAFSDPQEKNRKHEFWNMSPRAMAQYVGTEMFRNLMGEDFWIRRAAMYLSNQAKDSNAPEYVPEDTVMLTDVRFQNEANFIWNNGGIILHIVRPGCDGNVGIPGHASEAGIMFPGNFANRSYRIVNDSTIHDFHTKLRGFANFCGLNPKPQPAPHGINSLNL